VGGVGVTRRHAEEKSLELLVVGKGSNVLFDDRGFDGLVVINRVAFVECTVVYDDGGALIRVGAGEPFDRLGWRTVRDDWSGLEFATGIPGTAGGAVFMNAGANGSVSAALRVARSCNPVAVSSHLVKRALSTKTKPTLLVGRSPHIHDGLIRPWRLRQCVWDTIASVEYLTKAGELHVKSKAELPAAAYRWSAFMDMPDLAAITAATFHLHRDATAHERAQAMATRSVHNLCAPFPIPSRHVCLSPVFVWRSC